jgi:hypothetical protein
MRESTLEQELTRLQRTFDLRAIVALENDGTSAAWRRGIPAEDLRHELITSANKVAHHVRAERGEN